MVLTPGRYTSLTTPEKVDREQFMLPQSATELILHQEDMYA